MGDQLQCWKCGQMLEGVILPLSRREECRACGADQHVCKLCRHYNARTAGQCEEERAEAVADKETANFCDYFAPKSGAYQGSASEDAAARARLAELFGEAPAQAPGEPSQAPAKSAEQSKADAAMEELKRLFGESKD